MSEPCGSGGIVISQKDMLGNREVVYKGFSFDIISTITFIKKHLFLHHMKAIIIAAGMCNRLRPITDNLPKCMLKIKGKPLLQHAIDIFRANGITDISVIRGYKKEKIDFPNLSYFENTDYQNNNILHSLMHAKQKLREAIEQGEDVIVTYSDITFKDDVVKKLMQARNPISIVVDTDWHDYYDGRSDHPITEAENVVFNDSLHVSKIGKDVITGGIPQNRQGEFIGMWKFTPQGAKRFVEHFEKLNSTLVRTEKYQNAKEWRKAYITDILQDLTNRGEKIHCTVIQKGWKEFDTVQDFLRVGGQLPEGMTESVVLK